MRYDLSFQSTFKDMDLFQKFLFVVMLFLAAGLFTGTLSGCTSNPLAVAETPEQKAFALYGTFEAIQAEALTALSSPAIDDEFKLKLQSAHGAAIDPVRNLRNAALEVTAVREQYIRSGSGAQRLEVLSNNLLNIVAAVKPLVDSLKNSLGD